MKINNREFTIKYVDPSLVIADEMRNGLSPSTAYKSIPNPENNVCYVIKRSNVPTAMYQGTCTAQNVMIIGMPSENEYLYKFMPNEVKTAWIDQTEDKALLLFDRTSVSDPNASGQRKSLTAEGSNYTVFNSLSYLHIDKCFLYRSSSCSTNGTSGPGRMISVSNSNTSGVIKINNCHFGYNKLTFDETYAQNNESLPTEISQRCFDYIRIGVWGTFTAENCILDLTCRNNNNSSSSWVSGGFIFLNDLNNLYLNNITFNMLGNLSNNATDSTYQMCSAIRTENEHTTKDTNITNCIVNWFCQQAKTPCGVVFSLYNINNESKNTDKRLIRNIKNNIIQLQNFNPANALAMTLLDMNCVGGFVVENIDADFTNMPVKFVPSGAFIYITDSRITTASSNKRLVNNVNIKFPTDANVFNFSNTDLCVVFSAFGAGNVLDWDYTYDINRYNYTSYYTPIVKNIYISKKCALQCNCFNIVSGKIIGKLVANNGSYVELSSLINPDNTQEGIAFDSSSDPRSSFVHIKEYTYDNNENAVAQVTNYNTGKTLIIEKVNGDLPINKTFETTTSSSNNKLCYALFNNFDNGKFYIKNISMSAESSSIIRSGSSSIVSLKLTNNNFNSDAINSLDLRLGDDAVDGFKRNIIEGTYDFVAYFAVKGTDHTKLLRQFIIDIETNKSSLITSSEYDSNIFGNGNIYTSNNGFIEEDTSTWSDENVTAYKLIIPNVKVLNNNVNIKIRFNYYDVDGYIYLDPAFQFISKSN